MPRRLVHVSGSFTSRLPPITDDYLDSHSKGLHINIRSYRSAVPGSPHFYVHSGPVRGGFDIAQDPPPNFTKSILSPSQQVSFLGTVIDSVQMKATVSAERATNIQRHAASFEEGTARPLKAFQKMLGLMAAASPVFPFGLLHMRPIQFWLKQRVPSAAWRHGRHHVRVTRACVSALTCSWRAGTKMFGAEIAIARFSHTCSPTLASRLCGSGGCHHDLPCLLCALRLGQTLCLFLIHDQIPVSQQQ